MAFRKRYLTDLLIYCGFHRLSLLSVLFSAVQHERAPRTGPRRRLLDSISGLTFSLATPTELPLPSPAVYAAYQLLNRPPPEFIENNPLSSLWSPDALSREPGPPSKFLVGDNVSGTKHELDLSPPRPPTERSDIEISSPVIKQSSALPLAQNPFISLPNPEENPQVRIPLRSFTLRGASRIFLEGPTLFSHHFGVHLSVVREINIEPYGTCEKIGGKGHRPLAPLNTLLFTLCIPTRKYERLEGYQ